MTKFLPTVLLLATAALAPAQGPRPPQAPPLAFGITVGGQGLGVDVANKTVTVPPDWKVVAQSPAKAKAAALPPTAPPVQAPAGYVTYEQAVEAAKTGEVLTVFVGVSPKPVAGRWASTYYLDGIAPGVYTTRLGAAGPELVLASGVAAPVPFAGPAVTSGTTLLTPALPVAGVSTSRSVGWGVTRTRTAVPLTAPFGGTTIVNPFGGGCANGQCGAPQRTGVFGFGLFR